MSVLASTSISIRKRSHISEEAHEEIDSDTYVEYIPLRKRRQHHAAQQQQQPHQQQQHIQHQDEVTKRCGLVDIPAHGSTHQCATKQKSLVEIAAELKQQQGEQSVEAVTAVECEYVMNHIITHRIPLAGYQQIAKGLRYTEPMNTGWRPPTKYLSLSHDECKTLREKYHIVVQGENCPPPIKKWKYMRFPNPILRALDAKGIHHPTPIQIQGLPVVLSGRDMIGIAMTGSGKTMVFTLPMIMFALQHEIEHPQQHGPIGIILSPSRELSQQIYDIVQYFISYLNNAGYPKLRTLLCMGGINMYQQHHVMQRGIHMIIATPGRLVHMLNKKQLNMDQCKYIALDEADRLIDLGFEEDIRTILDSFNHQRQTVLFSATMPKTIQDFAFSSLVKPIIVNVGRAGATNLDIVQEVEYVKPQVKITYLLEVLQKTSPPVLIFASNQSHVDDIHEYLLLKGIDAVAIHGGKHQDDRHIAIQQFQSGVKDVLVATDVASKGLDFPDIQHVINYDMPREIEDYIHRIGRIGRCGRTGVATSFINNECSDIFLLDLKHLLHQAKQKIPPVLLHIKDPMELEGYDRNGCTHCHGLGHRIINCPKRMKQNRIAIKSSYGYDEIENDI